MMVSWCCALRLIMNCTGSRMPLEHKKSGSLPPAKHGIYQPKWQVVLPESISGCMFTERHLPTSIGLIMNLLKEVDMYVVSTLARRHPLILASYSKQVRR